MSFLSKLFQKCTQWCLHFSAILLCRHSCRNKLPQVLMEFNHLRYAITFFFWQKLMRLIIGIIGFNVCSVSKWSSCVRYPEQFDTAIYYQKSSFCLPITIISDAGQSSGQSSCYASIFHPCSVSRNDAAIPATHDGCLSNATVPHAVRSDDAALCSGIFKSHLFNTKIIYYYNCF